MLSNTAANYGTGKQFCIIFSFIYYYIRLSVLEEAQLVEVMMDLTLSNGISAQEAKSEDNRAHLTYSK
jgi:hypothetical protein